MSRLPDLRRTAHWSAPSTHTALFHVRTLGGLRHTADGSARTLRRKPLAVLTYLARRGARSITRTEVATLFWGERGEDRARQSLRQALLELKQALGDKVDVDNESVRLAADAVELDVTAFERDLAAGRVQEAVSRWSGDFFEGAEDIGGEGFRRWIENERVALHQQLGMAMVKLIGDAELSGDWAGAAAWAQQWATALPFDEQAHLRLIEALRMSGRGGDALKTHAAFVTRVRTALDVEPSAEFLDLGGGLTEGARDDVERKARGSAAVHAPALVGRGPAMAALLDAWRVASTGSPIVVLVEGSTGSGLTRVSDELVARVGGDAVVLRAAGKPSTTDFATAAELFEGIRAAEGSAGAAPEALAEVARIVPSLTTEFRHLPAATGDESALCNAMAQTLAAIGEEQAVLVLLDDLHDADDASRLLISALASRLSGRVLMVLTSDEGERQPGPAITALLATRGLRRLRLSDLTVAEVEAMLESMIAIESADRHALAVRLHEDSRGNPHDVRELVSALVDEHLLTSDSAGRWRTSTALAGRPLPVPSSVRDRVRSRLDRLPAAARALAETVAVLGPTGEPSVARQVAELTVDDAEHALRTLADRRLVVESSSGQYAFVSPVTARAVAASLPVSRRESLHARAAEVLTEQDLTTTAERSLLPYHLARAPLVATADGSTGTRSTRRWLVPAAIAGPVAAIALGAVALKSGLSFRPASQDAPVPVVALGRITDYRENQTTNLTKPLTDMLATNLGRVNRLRVVSAARIYELVSQAGEPGDTSDAALVRAARRAGATEIVDGALYSRENGGFRLDLRRVELASGNIQKTHSVTGTTVFELADSGTARVASDFGETTPVGSVADVTTRSLAAYRLYEQGLGAYFANDFRGAKPLFEAALREDSTFAMAAYYAALSELDNPRLALAWFALAGRLAARTSDRERLTILAREAFMSSSPALGAIAETLLVRYPDETEGYYFSGLSRMSEGAFLRAVAPLNRVVAMDSLALGGASARCAACEAMRQLVSLYQLADSLPAAEREARRWTRLQPRSPVPWHNLADVLSQQGKAADALQALDRAATLDAGRREAERLLGLAVHRMHAGDFDQADRLIEGELESGAPVRAGPAVWYRVISYRNQGRLEEALVAAKRHRADGMAKHPKGVVAARRAAPPEAVAEAQVLFEMGQYRASAALFDSVSRWSVGDESPSQNSHWRVWQFTQALGARAAAGDTIGLAAAIDTVQAIGAQSGLGRDKQLHHYVRGCLMIVRGQDDAAVAELTRAVWSWNFGYTRINMVLAETLLRLRRPREAIAALQPALRGTIEASNYYVTRTDIHELLGRAWSEMDGAAARDSAATHFAYVAKTWRRADPSFSARHQRAVAAASKVAAR